MATTFISIELDIDDLAHLRDEESGRGSLKGDEGGDHRSPGRRRAEARRADRPRRHAARRLEDVDKLVDTNALVTGRLDVTQERLSALIDTAKSFQKDLLAARNSANGGNIIAQPAAANLQSLIATLNVTMDGQYLFAGINTAVQPMTNYAAGSTSKTAIDAAFLALFGFAQNSPAVSTITAAKMQTFINTTFEAQFDDPGLEHQLVDRLEPGDDEPHFDDADDRHFGQRQ